MSASPNNNTLMLVALGLGAFWFLTRHPAQGGTYNLPRGAGAAQTSGGAITGQLVSQGGNLIGQLINRFTGGPTATATGAGSIFGNSLNSGNLYSLTPDFSPVNTPGVDLFSTSVSIPTWDPVALFNGLN